MDEGLRQTLSRRGFLGLGLGSAASATGAYLLGQSAQASAPPVKMAHTDHDSGGHGAGMKEMLVGAVDHQRNGFDPMHLLVDWDYGTLVEDSKTGVPVREYQVDAGDVEIEIAPGIFFPAWAYNARVPGPTIRCTEGDQLRIHFANYGSHPHTMHFHGFHPAEMDGVEGEHRGAILPGEDFTYEFDADPFGCHLYHCHAVPLKRHIHKGMYGAFIIDPQAGRPPAREFMMVMNAFDTNFDSANEIYAVNTVGHEFMHRPIPVMTGELIRIYLINVVEFDLINSFHLHGNFFDYYDTGTTLQPTLRTVDTIMQAQGQRGILEFRFRWPGRFMFHAHVSEFAELGWMGFFNAVKPADFNAALAEVGLDEEWDYKGTNGSTISQRSLAK
ncbi:MAG TPA: multicopper oxidase domain-containing protein [Phototrophicaceae bacterium]|nr:multicopper oxidase domain-containing protein [Phototrophicaceae bacterium]